MTVPPGEAKETTAIMAVLDRWFDALQDGSAALRFPDTGYVWRFYTGVMTVQRIRVAVADMDEYMYKQIGWVHSSGGMPEATRGPDLGRMPDHALMAMFQELDGLLAEIEAKAAAAPVLGGG